MVHEVITKLNPLPRVYLINDFSIKSVIRLYEVSQLRTVVELFQMSAFLFAVIECCAESQVYILYCQAVSGLWDEHHLRLSDGTASVGATGIFYYYDSISHPKRMC